MIELVLGGARSGKSRFAEARVVAQGLEKHYVATAQALDDEMQARIRHHQAGRGDAWVLHEEPIALATTIEQHAKNSRVILVDCLTLWITNCLLHRDAGLWLAERERFLHSLTEAQGNIVMVSNEVSWGIVPMDALSRRFVDETGRLHQDIAAIADRVTLVVAGLPQTLKS